MLLCDLCNFTSSFFKDYLSHHNTIHGKDLNYNSKCPATNCVISVTSYSALYRHVHKHHLEIYNNRNKSRETCSDSEGQQETVDNEPSEHGAEDVAENEENDDFKKRNAIYLLGMLDKLKLTLSDLEILQAGTSSLLTETLQSIESKLKKLFVLHSINDPELQISVSDLFSEDNSPWLGLQTNYMQMKFFREQLGYIDPVRIELETNGHPDQSKPHSFSYIPLVDQLERLLNNPSIHDEVFGARAPTLGDKLCDVCDGAYYKCSEFFKQHPEALQIILYYDDVEFCNPLGSKSFKTGCVYFTLGNIRPEHRSKLKCIFTLMKFRTSLLKHFDINNVFLPLVDDIKRLEEGVEITIMGEKRVIFGTLVTIAADNLASNAMGGFKEGFTAVRMCRSCLGNREEVQNSYKDSDFVSRTKNVHAKQCKDMQGPVFEYLSKAYGINRDSVFNQLSHYHVAENGLTPDVMHDILEGTFHIVIKHLLKKYILRRELFTLSTLNEAIQNFDYGYSEISNKPTQITEHILKRKGKFKQSAAQMWCLATILPLLIGQYVPQTDNYWKCYKLLLKICRICFSMSVSQTMIADLELKVEKYLQMHKKLFKHLLPKQHFMVHYPRYMALFGPLRLLWCMRFEGKHQVFKQLALIIGNFINLGHTLSVRGQLTLCHDLNTSCASFFDCDTKVKQAGVSLLSKERCGGQVAQILGFNSLDKHVPRLTQIKLDGQVYRLKHCIILADYINRVPQFGQLVNIFMHEKTVLFELSMYTTRVFQKHYQGYEIRSRDPTYNQVLKLDTLLDKNVYHVHKLDHTNMQIIVLREARPEMFILEQLS